MKETNVIKITYGFEIPENFTGIAEFPDASKYWFKEGNYHREDGPAIEYPDGTKAWYKEGKYHREGGPAIERTDGTKKWYKEGQRHREDGPAAEYPNGTKYWFLNGTEYFRIKLKDHIILDSYKGNYNLMRYKLLTKDKIFECPDIPGLIEK